MAPKRPKSGPGSTTGATLDWIVKVLMDFYDFGMHFDDPEAFFMKMMWIAII